MIFMCELYIYLLWSFQALRKELVCVCVLATIKELIKNFSSQENNTNKREEIYIYYIQPYLSNSMNDIFNEDWNGKQHEAHRRNCPRWSLLHCKFLLGDGHDRSVYMLRKLRRRLRKRWCRRPTLYESSTQRAGRRSPDVYYTCTCLLFIQGLKVGE